MWHPQPLLVCNNPGLRQQGRMHLSSATHSPHRRLKGTGDHPQGQPDLEHLTSHVFLWQEEEEWVLPEEHNGTLDIPHATFRYWHRMVFNKFIRMRAAWVARKPKYMKDPVTQETRLETMEEALEQ